MDNLYLPRPVKITKIAKLSPNVKLFRLVPLGWKFRTNKEGLVFRPAQFILVGVFGYGEAPLGIASSPFEKRYLEIVVRKVGQVTGALHSKKIGETIWLRGPCGNGFPLDFFERKDIITLTGGCGIPPIASLIEYIITRREKFGRVYLLYGARTPSDILLKDRIEKWKKSVEVLLSVDQPDKTWKGHIGLVGELTKFLKVSAQNSVVAMCGPGPMTKAIENILRPLGISDRRIYVSEERKMSCGIGKCQHCTTGEKYVCLDGPVFNFDEIDRNWD